MKSKATDRRTFRRSKSLGNAPSGSQKFKPKTKVIPKFLKFGKTDNANVKKELLAPSKYTNILKPLVEKEIGKQNDTVASKSAIGSIVNTQKTAEERQVEKVKKLAKVQQRKEKSLSPNDPDLMKRTIYVGNVNVKAKRKDIESYFSKFGQIECSRIRGVPVESMEVTKKQAITMNKLHPSRKTFISYVRFKEESSVSKALDANGEIFMNFHLRVDHCNINAEKDINSIFVGNLPLDVQDEDLWKHFKQAGNISSVRVVRSNVTGSGKGFGFVCFKDKESVNAALLLNDKKLKGRNLRVKKIAKKPKYKPEDKKKMTQNKSMAFLTRDKPKEVRDRIDKRMLKKKMKADQKVFSGVKDTTKEPKHNKKVNKGLQKHKKAAELLCGKNAEV